GPVNPISPATATTYAGAAAERSASVSTEVVPAFHAEAEEATIALAAWQVGSREAKPLVAISIGSDAGSVPQRASPRARRRGRAPVVGGPPREPSGPEPAVS